MRPSVFHSPYDIAQGRFQHYQLDRPGEHAPAKMDAFLSDSIVSIDDGVDSDDYTPEVVVSGESSASSSPVEFHFPLTLAMSPIPPDRSPFLISKLCDHSLLPSVQLDKC